MSTPPLQPSHNHRNSWSVRMVHSILQQYALDQAVWHYEHGLVVSAIAEAGKTLSEPRFTAFAQDWVDHFVTEDGAIRTYRIDEYNLDQVNPGKLLFYVYQATGAERYRRALGLIRNQLRNQPRTHSGGYWHKRIYPYQMWLDGIYMAAPFFAQYALVFDEPVAFDDITRQIILCEQHTRDPLTGLLYHAWDESKSQKWANPVTGCSPSFWGRAIGWFVMALVDVLDFLPPKHPNFPIVLEILQRLAGALIRYQDPKTGLWYQVVDAAGYPGNYRESSASAMLAYGFAKGARKGWLGGDILLSAHRAYRGLLENQIKVDARGLLTLENVCSVGGLGGDPYRDGSFEYYISEKVVANDFKGVGPFVLAALELESSEVLIKGSD